MIEFLIGAAAGVMVAAAAMCIVAVGDDGDD